MFDHKTPLRSFRHLLLWSTLAVLVPVNSSLAQISVSIDLFAPPPVALAPPPLPVYVVPLPPSNRHIWAPGYWGWSGEDYYWVPGTWVRPPQVGLLWTPGYWGWRDNAFVWRGGYWGRRVGFYGGINYGGGYTSAGFFGGRWVGQAYQVNRRVVNVTNITNITRVTNVTKVNRVALTTSFNGGEGGTRVAATPAQLAEARVTHPPLPREQMTHVEQASRDRQLHVSANKGKPLIAATREAAVFTSKEVVAAREAGAANPKADQYNERVRKDPALAKGAALPKTEPGNNDKPQGNPPGAKAETAPLGKPGDKPAANQQPAGGATRSHQDKAQPGPSPTPAPTPAQPMKKPPATPNPATPGQANPEQPTPKSATAKPASPSHPAAPERAQGPDAAVPRPAAPDQANGNADRPVRRHQPPREAPTDAAQKPHKMPAPQDPQNCEKSGAKDCKK